MHKALFAACAVVFVIAAAKSPAQEPLTMSGVLRSSTASDWRQPEPEDLLYMQLDKGLVVFELAPDFAPRHIENLRSLADDHYFDGLAIVRSQENYVVQWADPGAGSSAARNLGQAKNELEPEFYRTREGLAITRLDSEDAYADEVGFATGFPVASDGNRAWIAHCYGTLGVGRATAANSGNSSELYAVIGHAPRHLDRNVTLIGRALLGLQHLSTLPRGTGSLGFYESAEERTPVRTIRFGDQLAVADRIQIEVLRTDTQTFSDLIEARRGRREEWFVDPVGKVGLCNVPIPVRVIE